MTVRRHRRLPDACRVVLAAWLALALGSCARREEAPPLALAIGQEPGARIEAAARVRVLGVRGAAREAFERGEVELFVGNLTEFLRSARHGGRTARVLAARQGSDALCVLARPDIERAIELKGRSVGLDPDQDGWIALRQLLSTAGLELADVRIARLDRELFRGELDSGALDAFVQEGRAHEAAFELRELVPERGAPLVWSVLVGSTELAQAQPQRLERLLAALAPEPLPGEERALLRAHLHALEQELVAQGELIGPTGGADALDAAGSSLRRLDG